MHNYNYRSYKAQDSDWDRMEAVIAIILAVVICLALLVNERSLPSVMYSNTTGKPVYLETSTGQRIPIHEGQKLPDKFHQVWIK